MSFIKHTGFWLSLGGVVLVDQVTKGLVEQGWWDKTLVINNGISFGLQFGSNQFQTILLILLWLLMGWILLTKFGYKSLYIGIFLGGGLSNLIDRLVWGGVRDWMSWPIIQIDNNLADWAIAIGLAGLVYDIWIKRQPLSQGSASRL